MSDKILWQLFLFAELGCNDLYAILSLRASVFILEQKSLYQDLDYLDQESLHLLGLDDKGKLIAYTRILPPSLSKNQHASIGRVVLDKAHRGSGIGRELMRRSIKCCQQHWPENNIKISAQVYLQKFYESFGFKKTSELYDDAGVMHIDMLKNL